MFALVQRSQSPGAKSFELMPGLYAVVDEETVDNIIRSESDHARFVAGLVVWRAGELRAEIESGAWYVLAPDPGLVLHKPSQGLWEELVRVSKMRANSITVRARSAQHMTTLPKSSRTLSCTRSATGCSATTRSSML